MFYVRSAKCVLGCAAVDKCIHIMSRCSCIFLCLTLCSCDRSKIIARKQILSRIRVGQPLSPHLKRTKSIKCRILVQQQTHTHSHAHASNVPMLHHSNFFLFSKLINSCVSFSSYALQNFVVFFPFKFIFYTQNL